MAKRKLLSGNYEVKPAVARETQSEQKADEEFQLAAMAKLGGSIAFVRGRKLVGDG